MKKLLTSYNISECDIMKSILDENGIRCFIKNEILTGLVGELPPLNVIPELWIENDEEFALASNLIKDAENEE